MGGKFINKHKRKGALASLLLLFRSRAKYFLPLLLIVGAATPFIATTENFSRLMNFPPAAAFLNFTGLSKAFMALNPNYDYSAKGLKNAFARDRAYDKDSSFWVKLLNKMSSNTPGTHSSIAMLRGTDILKEGEDPSKVEQGLKENSRGVGNVDVNAEGLVPDVAGMMEENGMLGNIMGANLADRQGGSAGYNRGSPFMNKDLMAMNGGAADKYDGKYDGVLDKTADGVPAVGAASKVNRRKMVMEY